MLTMHREVIVCHFYRLPMIVTLSLEFIPKKGLQAGRPMPGYFLSLNVPNTSCLDGTQTTSTATRRVLGRLFNALLCCLDLLSSFFLQQRHIAASKVIKNGETCFTSRRTNSAWGLEGKIWENYGTKKYKDAFQEPVGP